MTRTKALALSLLFAVAPTTVHAQQLQKVQAGLSQQTQTLELRRDAIELQRRRGWEVGAVLGGIGGAAFGYMLVVFHNDGLAEKWGVAPTAATILGSAAIGAGLGALLQSVLGGN